jgi:hypothetical protein
MGREIGSGRSAPSWNVYIGANGEHIEGGNPKKTSNIATSLRGGNKRRIGVEKI